VLLALTVALALLLPAGCAKKRDSVTNPRTGPTANFVAAPVSGDRPLDVDFTDQSTAGTSAITSFLWSFGDGATSTEHNPAYSYSAPGVYTVSLTVTTAVGSDTETKTDLITVSNGSGPIAAFSGTPTGGAAPLDVQFTDQSTAGSAPITSRSWTFGDGGTSTAVNPSHTYLANGTYTVSLSVTTSVGNDTETKTGYITVSPAPVLPTAAFSGSPRNGTAPLLVDFTDESSPGSAPITSWTWAFGDGTPTSTTPNPSHTYAGAGTFNVSLTVTTSAGTDSETKTGYITVTVPPVPPTAEFSGTPTTGPAPLEVQFTDQSTAGSAPITSRLWNFGDGTPTSNATSPMHTYTAVGSYNVTLTVTTADGADSQTKTAYIQVCETPAADFSGSPTLGVAPLGVQFTDQSTGGATSWFWTFGDGGTSTVENPSHTYSGTGTYDVSLTVRNACGSNTTTKPAYITVVDACPNPTYTVVNAQPWTNVSDTDGDGYRTRGRLTWNVNVSPAGCSKSVFARIYYRAVGETTWLLKSQTDCYTVLGSRALNPRSEFIEGLPFGCYDFRIVLYECGGTVEKAVLEPTGDSDLTNQCFELP
jgi:PKD repeat protein